VCPSATQLFVVGRAHAGVPHNSEQALRQIEVIKRSFTSLQEVLRISEKSISHTNVHCPAPCCVCAVCVVVPCDVWGRGCGERLVLIYFLFIVHRRCNWRPSRRS